MATNKISSSSFCSKSLVALFLLGTVVALARASSLGNNDNAEVAGEMSMEMRQDGNGTTAEVAQGGPGASSSGSRMCRGNSNNEHCYQSNYCQSDRNCRNNRDCCQCGGLGRSLCDDYCEEKWGRNWDGECYECYCRCYRGRN